MMNVTANGIIEDDLRLIPMKEIIKDWLLICVSIIAIGKLKNDSPYKQSSPHHTKIYIIDSNKS